MRCKWDKVLSPARDIRAKTPFFRFLTFDSTISKVCKVKVALPATETLSLIAPAKEVFLAITAVE
jgi:hypothetical protein